MSLIDTLLHFILERRAENTTLDEMRTQLASSAETVAARLEKAADTPANRQRAGHVIGIERWGDRRLHVILGEPLVQDEYDSYRPTANLPMPDLARLFRDTRAETIALVDRLHPYAGEKVPHNQIGLLTPAAWLIYLNNHALMESRRLR